MTTAFAQTLSNEEASDKIEAIGWVPDFRTHILSLTPIADGATDDECTRSTLTQLTNGVADNDSLITIKSFCPFRRDSMNQGDSNCAKRESPEQAMRLEWDPGTPNLPNYMPLWVVAVCPQLMKNHDDIWNPQIVRLISMLFERVYEQSEIMHGGAKTEGGK